MIKTIFLCGLLCAALCFLFLTAGPVVALAASIACLMAWAASRGVRPLAVALSLLAFSSLPASAATASGALETLTPYLPMLMEMVVTPFIIWAFVQVGRKFGVDIQDKHKRTLQSALTTGANLALQHKLTGRAAVEVILDHVLGKGAPDAVANFKLSKDELVRMAEAKLHETLVLPPFHRTCVDAPLGARTFSTFRACDRVLTCVRPRRAAFVGRGPVW